MCGNGQANASWAQSGAGGGVSGQMMLATPQAMRAAKDIQVGDVLRTSAGGPVSVVARREVSPAREWVRIPPLALGNRREVLLAPDQNILIESSYGARIVGSVAVVLPAMALRHWRGIALSRARAETPAFGVSFTLSRPALVLGCAGVLIAFDGPANDVLDTADLPPVPALSMASAQQLMACLIAHEAGQALGRMRPQSAVM